MPGFLVDTHTLIWLISGQWLAEAAKVTMARSQQKGGLFVSPISAWEAGAASLKIKPSSRPNLLGLTADVWFKEAMERSNARLLPVDSAIAIEAASVPAIYGSGDPGDCFLIATARIHDLTLVTRDVNN